MFDQLLKDDQPVSPQMAKMLGLQDYDPENPPMLSEILFAQLTTTNKQLEQNAAVNRARIQEKYNKILNRNESDLTPEQEADANQVREILGLYPRFITPIKLMLATLVRRELEVEGLLNAPHEDPNAMLKLYDQIQELLMQQVPEHLWPESMRPQPQEQEQPQPTGS